MKNSNSFIFFSENNSNFLNRPPNTNLIEVQCTVDTLLASGSSSGGSDFLGYNLTPLYAVKEAIQLDL